MDSRSSVTLGLFLSGLGVLSCAGWFVDERVGLVRTREREQTDANPQPTNDVVFVQIDASVMPQLSFLVHGTGSRPVGSVFWDLTLDCEPSGSEIRLCCYDTPDPRCTVPHGNCTHTMGQWRVPWPHECQRVTFMTLTATPGIQCAPLRVREYPVSRESRFWSLDAVCDIEVTSRDR